MKYLKKIALTLEMLEMFPNETQVFVSSCVPR